MVKANASVRLTWLTALLLTTNVLTVSYLQASTIEAINHTHWAINRFSVDGRSGIDIIGAYQGGGGGCCYIALRFGSPIWQCKSIGKPGYGAGKASLVLQTSKNTLLGEMQVKPKAVSTAN